MRPRPKGPLTVATLIACGALAGVQPGGTDSTASPLRQAVTVDDERIRAAASAEPGNWLAHGRTYKEHRFPTLAQVNRETVGRLGLAWHKEIGDDRERMQGTPLVVDGVMYATNGWSVVFALDARTGTELWRFDPKTNREYVRYSCCGGVANRGVAIYEGRVHVATYDGRLFALDATNGTVVWEVDTWHPTALGRFNITGAPRAAAGKVFIGQGSSESGRRRGYVTAYDAKTGAVVWRFYLTPGHPEQPFEHPEMELAAKTWGGEWWRYGGGGTAWNALVYDEELGSLYIGVGNGSPWPRTIRSPGGGDDLFLTAIVAVDADSGRMKWHYQTVPGDNWDYSAAMDMALGELEIDGKRRKVLLQAPKNGFFYVIDRVSGELLRAHPYTKGITWASHVDMATGRPVENPAATYDETPAWVLPGNAGAHNWEPMSWDEERGVMYFYYHDLPQFYALDETFVATGRYDINPVGLSLGIGFGPYLQALGEKVGPGPEPVAYLVAFEPVSGVTRWKVQLPAVFNGGVLATTGGLVFHGDGAGQLSAYDVDDGKRLWEFDGQGSFSSPIVAYVVDGEQHVATMVSGSLPHARRGTLLAFKLNGKVTLPAAPERTLSIPEPPAYEASEETLAQGNALYHQHCASCHRGLSVASVVATATPDLRMMTAETHAQFPAIVLGGSKRALGMPGFADTLDWPAAAAIRAFVAAEATKARAEQAAYEAQEGTEGEAPPREAQTPRG